MTPEEYIRRKHIYDTALTSEQVDALTQQFREASAWIVGQDEAYIIGTYYEVAARIAEGKLSAAEARRLIRQTLLTAGYRADSPGSWGDMAQGTARQKLVLDTNVKKAAGYAWYESIKGNKAYPAQKLVRMGARRDPRNWPARWRHAWAALPQDERVKAHPTEMVATTDCAIWRGISRWGDPYPPFDYNSGMDVVPVDFDTANAMGILRGSTKDERTLYGVKKELPQGKVPPEIEVELQGWIDDALV